MRYNQIGKDLDQTGMKKMNEITKNQNSTGIQQTSNDLLKNCILNLVNAMKADFGKKFEARFPNTDEGNEDLRQYKRRLYAKLRDREICDIIDGYENFIDSKPDWPPTVPDLIAAVKDASFLRHRKELSDAELERKTEAAKAGPMKKQIECNPIAMLREARSNADQYKDENTEKRAIRRKQIINHHGRLIIDFEQMNHSRLSVPAVGHTCSVAICFKPGVLSHSVNGVDNWYCQEHFRT